MTAVAFFIGFSCGSMREMRGCGAMRAADFLCSFFDREMRLRPGGLSRRGIGRRDSEQFDGFGAKTQKLWVFGLVSVHPLNGFCLPCPGFIFVAEVIVGHRQKEEVVAIAAVA